MTGIDWSYGERRVLHGFSLELAPGEVFGLLGPNGAGKSTTLRLACGLARPDRGTVAVGGVPLAEDPALARRTIGAQIDGPDFWGHLSLRANLELLAGLSGATGGQVGDLLLTLGLANHASRRAGEASVGLRQRLGLAAALLGGPSLLILDEPTAGLDPRGAEAILGLVRRLARDRGLTVLFTSHDLAGTAAVADRVGVIASGRLVHLGEGGLPGLLRAGYYACTATEAAG